MGVKQTRNSPLPASPTVRGDLVRDLSLVFFYLIYVVRGRSPRGF